MARSTNLNGMTIAQLERVIEQRRKTAAELRRERDKLQKKVEALDRKIMALDGRRTGAAAAGRSRNEHSLVQTMEMVLHKAGKPLPVGDIVNSVLKSGYQTISENFRGLVNQTLIKEKQFSSAGRGVYQLKK